MSRYVANAVLKHPVAALGLRARFVRRRRHVGARQTGQVTGGLIAVGALGEVAAVNENVGPWGERRLDGGEIAGIGCDHCSRVQGCRSKIEIGLTAVRQDLNSADPGMSGQILGNLMYAIFGGVEEDNTGRGRYIFQQRLHIGDGRIYKNNGLGVVSRCRCVAQGNRQGGARFHNGIGMELRQAGPLRRRLLARGLNSGRHHRGVEHRARLKGAIGYGGGQWRAGDGALGGLRQLWRLGLAAHGWRLELRKNDKPRHHVPVNEKKSCGIKLD